MRVAVIGGGLGGLAAACVLARARPSGDALRQEPVARRQGGAPGGAGLPLRHGPDHPHRAARAGAHLRRGRAQAGRPARPRPPRPAMALLLRRRHPHRPGRGPAGHGRRDGPVRARHRGRRRAIAASRTSPGTCTTSPSGSSSGSRSRTCSTPSTSRPTSTPARCATCSRCAWAARSPAPSARGSRTRAWRRCSTTSPSMSAPRPTARRPCSAPSPTCRRPRASGTRWAAPAPSSTALVRLASELGCELRTGEEVTGLRIERDTVRAVQTAAGETPVDAVVSNMDAIRTYRELVGGAAARRYDRKGFEPACSGVVLYLGPQPPLRASGAPRLRLLARPRGGVRLHLQARRAGARSHLLPRRSRRDRSRRGAGRRRGALRPGPHALPAAAPRLVGNAPGLPQDHPRQAEAHGRPARHRGAHRGRAAPDAAGHPRALQGAERRDLRPCEPRQVHRRLQARQPQPRRSAASTSPAARPIRGRACRW